MMMGSINFFMVWGICLFDNNLGVGRFSCGARILWFFRAESLCGNFWAGIRPLIRSGCHCWSIRAEICLQIRSDCCRQAIRAENYLKTRAESLCGNFWAGIGAKTRAEPSRMRKCPETPHKTGTNTPAHKEFPTKICITAQLSLLSRAQNFFETIHIV